MKKINLQFGTVTAIILLAAFSRLLPHPANFAPLGAMALFGAAHYKNRYMAVIIPMVSMFLCDLAITNLVYSEMYNGFVLFYPGCLFTYLSLLLITCVGFLIFRQVSIGKIVIGSLSASVIFFLVSNFGTWISGMMLYTKDISGLISCYIAGLPFFKNTIAGDLLYSGILFGVYKLANYTYSTLTHTAIR